MTEPEQSSLPGLVRDQIRAAKKPTPKRPVPLAEVDPVAGVWVDVGLAHLDRPFDYTVPETMADAAARGVRVKVRFAGQDVDGFIVDRRPASEHEGRLQPLRRVVSPEPVLSEDIAHLCGVVAQRYAGTRSDVLRLAVPPRHATVEKRPTSPTPEPAAAAVSTQAWSEYARGPETLRAWSIGERQRAVMSVLPGDDWADLMAEAVVATYSSGRGALVCVPDRRDLDRLDRAVTRRLGSDTHTVLAADLGPAARYEAFLTLSRGQRRIALGTRAAAFAPVHDLGLVAIWDDGDDLHREQRAPYPHAREVLLERARASDLSVLLMAHARSVEAAYLLHTGWAHEVAGERSTIRDRVSVSVAGAREDRPSASQAARVPPEAFALLRRGLSDGPVLVQAPRSGYATRLACERCRARAECPQCHGPLRQVDATSVPECGWCGVHAHGWSCPECGGHGLRAPVLGHRRTAEELGRAFPGVPVRTSSADHIVETVEQRPEIVVATPGAEPVATGGYAAVLLLDTWLLLARADLRAEEEAMRRWANTSALVRPGGRVLLVGDPTDPVCQALVRWDPGGLADRLMAERRAAHLPPASRVATLTGEPAAVAEAIAGLELPPGGEVLGPVPVEEEQRYVVRVPRAFGAALSESLALMQSLRSAHKQRHVRVVVDPDDLG